ncbi:MAG: hypothetical protein IT467_11660 [Dokdonella sp.]|uniref:hypothetical protein n=1 Tax=Dokdonella sp. TaxID=2291710 RepID=UPI0025C0C84F|nr:hypothetical protein [Dokdonella sp.]MBZ0222266.1 hypothetical protein [Dokdonella sp.]MCC7256573.1 hypothetical protein [Dokdonella sp.]
MNDLKHSRWTAVAIALAACISVPAAIAAAPDSVSAPAVATYWQMIPAATFVTRSSNMSYSYANGGCVTLPSGTDFTHRLLLPAGATLRYVRTYFRDTGPGSVFSAVSQYDAAGGLVDMGAMNSPNAGGYSSMLSPDLAHMFDPVNHAYVINVQYRTDDTIFLNGFESGAGEMLFCGVRVMWDMP